MFPWMWIFYAPQYRFPWGGDWAQQVDTDTVVRALTPGGSGNAQVEKQALGIASYGRQLGWLTEALLGNQSGADSAAQQQGALALQRLREAQQRIDALKPQEDAQALATQAAAALERLRQADPQAYRDLLRSVPALPPTPATAALPAPRAARKKSS